MISKLSRVKSYLACEKLGWFSGFKILAKYSPIFYLHFYIFFTVNRKKIIFNIFISNTFYFNLYYCAKIFFLFTIVYNLHIYESFIKVSRICEIAKSNFCYINLFIRHCYFKTYFSFIKYCNITFLFCVSTFNINAALTFAFWFLLINTSSCTNQLYRYIKLFISLRCHESMRTLGQE